MRRSRAWASRCLRSSASCSGGTASIPPVALILSRASAAASTASVLAADSDRAASPLPPLASPSVAATSGGGARAMRRSRACASRCRRSASRSAFGIVPISTVAVGARCPLPCPRRADGGATGGGGGRVPLNRIEGALDSLARARSLISTSRISDGSKIEWTISHLPLAFARANVKVVGRETVATRRTIVLRSSSFTRATSSCGSSSLLPSRS